MTSPSKVADGAEFNQAVRRYALQNGLAHGQVDHERKEGDLAFAPEELIERPPKHDLSPPTEKSKRQDVETCDRRRLKVPSRHTQFPAVPRPDRPVPTNKTPPAGASGAMREGAADCVTCDDYSGMRRFRNKRREAKTSEGLWGLDVEIGARSGRLKVIR